jgi:hypothetical protein
MNTESKIFEALGATEATASRWPQARIAKVEGTPFKMVTFGDGSVSYLNTNGMVVPRLEVVKQFWLDVMGKPNVMNYFLSTHRDLWPEPMAQALANATAKDTFSALLFTDAAKSGERFA